MNANRAIAFSLGLLTMAGTHLVEAAKWTSWFGGAYRPWFLNSGSAAAFTIISLLVVSLIAGWFRLSGLLIGAGAVVAMTLVLFFGNGGAGSIFPIALGAGALFVAGVTWFGAWVGTELGRWGFSRR